MDLPANVRLQNAKTELYCLEFSRGGKKYRKCGKDVAALVAWREETEAVLDAEGVAKTQVRSKASKQSSTPGVYWNARKSKWIGRCYDKLDGKSIYTSSFADEADAIAAQKVLHENTEARFEAEMTRRYALAVQTTPNLAGLPRAPKRAEDAEKGTVYWHVSSKGDHQPYRAVRDCKQFAIACAVCHQKAVSNALGEKPTHCIQHGGGGGRYCKHERERTTCRECNPNILNCVANCSICGNKLGPKRKTTKGGNGVCPACEDRHNAQAAENGASRIPKSKRWEDVVFDALLPNIFDADGKVVSPELRDDFRNVLGSLYKETTDGAGRKLRKRLRGREDCDTTTFRRPDTLFVRRDPATAHIVAVLSVEVEEDCHRDRKFSCETGKIEDTFESIQKIAAREGASALSRTGMRVDAEFVYYAVFKFNPNACDVTPPVCLDDRIEVLAQACSAFLSRNPEEYKALPIEERRVPHVTTFYYHSDAASIDAPGDPSRNFLRGYAEMAPHWAWHGNVTASA